MTFPLTVFGKRESKSESASMPSTAEQNPISAKCRIDCIWLSPYYGPSSQRCNYRNYHRLHLLGFRHPLGPHSSLSPVCIHCWSCQHRCYPRMAHNIYLPWEAISGKIKRGVWSKACGVCYTGDMEDGNGGFEEEIAVQKGGAVSSVLRHIR